MSNPELPKFEESAGDIGLKEVVSMIQDTIDETKATEEEVNKVLDELYLEPFPYPQDEAAKLAYKEKMENLLTVARAQNARAGLIQSMERCFKEKLAELEESS
ncbi:hypothetical protein HYU82_00795 [Candidatus Saccharibacteria bacterium]|nr:hypothetical protein [Candidatus Saccharibacteria bacterium]